MADALVWQVNGRVFLRQKNASRIGYNDVAK